MSVQSEIDRIITAVGNAYSKVSEKGGTVPASQTVANLATAIDSIPAGGGSSGDFKIEFGSFTPAVDSGKNGYMVNHSLGTAPYIISYYTSNSVGGHYNKNGASIASIDSKGFINSTSGFDGLKSGANEYHGDPTIRYGSRCFAIISISDTSFIVGRNHNYSSSIGCKAGVTYYWVAIA